MDTRKVRKQEKGWSIGVDPEGTRQAFGPDVEYVKLRYLDGEIRVEGVK